MCFRQSAQAQAQTLHWPNQALIGGKNKKASNQPEYYMDNLKSSGRSPT